MTRLLIVFLTLYSTVVSAELKRVSIQDTTYTCMPKGMYQQVIFQMVDDKACQSQLVTYKKIDSLVAKSDTLQKANMNLCLASRDSVIAGAGKLQQIANDANQQRWWFGAVGASIGIVFTVLLNKL